MIEFKAWPKTPRLNRDCIVTEKIDGTNAAVIILDPIEVEDGHNVGAGETTPDGTGIAVWNEKLERMQIVAAQSRKRVIWPGKTTDNAGFAMWVWTNAQALAETLGEGYHYGEWYGTAIQGNPYALEEKRFSLFNVVRYAEFDLENVPGLGVVPVLYEGPFDQAWINNNLIPRLRVRGSVVSPGRKAEGVIVFHKAAGHVYKVLCENDELPKGVAENG